MRCPNISHPDWIELVKKIGEENAYIEYLRNDEDIPNPANYSTKEEYAFAAEVSQKILEDSSKLLPGFTTYYQQSETVNTIASNVLAYIKANPKTVFYKNKLTDNIVTEEYYNSISDKQNYVRKVRPSTFNQAIKNFEEELNNVIKEFPDQIKYKTVQDNLTNLRELTKNKLEALGLINKVKLTGINITRNTPEATEVEGLEEVEDISVDYWKDDWVFSFDSKANALRQVKQFLAFIPRTQYNKDTQQLSPYSQVDSYLSNGDIRVPSFMGYDEVFEQLKALLADVDNTWDEMYKVLDSHKQSKPWIYNLLYYQLPNYQGDVEQLKKQFVSVMSSSYTNYGTILWKEKGGAYSFNFVNTDQANVVSSITKEWGENFKLSKLVNKDSEGNLVNNDKAISKLLEFIDSISDTPTKENVNRILKAVGIKITEDTLDLLVNKKIRNLSIKQQFISNNGLFFLIKQRLKGIDGNINQEEDLKFQLKNPIINNSAINILAKVDAQYNTYAYSNSLRNGQGNTVYSYTFNKALTRKYRRLINDSSWRKRLLDISFTKPIMKGDKPIYKNWLYELEHNKAFADIFNIRPLDTLRQQQQGSKGLKVSELSDLDLETLQVTLLQNNGAEKRGVGRVVNYLLTVPSKTTSYVLQGSGLIPNLLFSGSDYQLDNANSNALYSIAASEHNRIISQQGRSNSNNAYKTGSKKFFFFPNLNSTTSPEIWNTDGTVKLPTTILEDGNTVEDYIRKKVIQTIKGEVTKTILRWKSLGIIKTSKEGVDSLAVVDTKYFNKYLSSLNNTESIIYAAYDYKVNSILSKYNAHQLFIGDPALYWKKNIKDTWDNIDKRLASLIAPGKDLALDSTDEKFLSVSIQDREGGLALNQAQLLSRLKEAGYPYTNITGTDAQEYTTLKEDLYVRFKLGILPTDTYNSLLKRIDIEGDNLVLTRKELGTVLQPVKPVYSDSSIIDTEDVATEVYIKSSSIPLIPQFTIGLEIDKLRKSIEKLEKDRELPVRAAFASAVKVGGRPPISIFNSDGTIKEGLDLKDSATLLDRGGFRIQQEVPYNPTKEEVVKQSQATKLLFDSILNIDGFNYEGKEYTGAALRERYTELHKELYNNSLKSVRDKLLTDEKLDINKLQKILLEEAINRGYSHTEIEALSLTDDNKFRMAFWANPGANKLEALITSIYSSNVARQKMHGRSLVLTSEEGLKGKSNGVIYSKDYDPEVGLRPMRLVYAKEGEVLEFEQWNKLDKAIKDTYKEVNKPAQVLIPWNFRNKTGKKLNIKNYIGEDGLVDTKKLPITLLRQFAFRVPNQGHNSMSLIEVVGFLPDIMEETVVASRNFITQMGSDFDVDKLFIYDYYTTVTTSGKLIKQNNIKNDILDIHKAVLGNPLIYNNIVTPLSLGKLKYDTETGPQGIAVDLKKLEEELRDTYLSPDYTKEKYLQSVDGKAMVSITSLASTFNALSQGRELALQKKVEKDFVPDSIIVSYNNKILKLSKLSDAFTVTGRTKTSVIAAYQSAAVDNEKDPILGLINSNPFTSSVQNLLAHLGLEEDYISSFLALPALKEYVNKVRLNRGSLSEDTRKSDDTILDEIIAEKLSKLKIDIKGVENLEDYPLAVEHFKQVLFKTTPYKFSTYEALTPEQIEYLALLKFQKVKTFGDVLDRIKNTINIESGGIGKSLLDVADRTTRVNSFAKEGPISNTENLLGEFNEGLKPTTISGYVINDALLEANKVFNENSLLPYSSGAVIKAFEEYENIINRKASLDEKFDLWNSLKSYIFSDLFPNKRESLFFDRGANKSLATRINALKDTKYRTNPFILRLSTNIDPSGIKPSVVSYNAAKEENIEELNVYQGLTDLLINSDPVIKQIGADLVSYFYINGGIQKAKEWGKYINLNYLEQLGIIDTLNKIIFKSELLGDTNEPSNFITQYFQHNPYRLPKLNLEELDKVSYKGGSIMTASSLTLPPPLGENGITSLARGTSYSSIFAIRNPKGSKGYSVYIRDSKEYNKFNRLSILGGTNYQEYNSKEQLATSLIGKSVKLPPLSTKVEFTNKSLPHMLEKKTISNTNTIGKINKLTEATILGEALSLIKETGSKTNKLLATFLRNTGLVDNISLQEATNTGYIGKYSKRGTANNPTRFIEINHSRLSNNENSYHTTFIHEGIHALSDLSFSNSGFNPTGAQIQARKNLERIHKGLVDRVIKGEVPGFDTSVYNELVRLVNKAKNKEVLTKEERDFIGQHHDLYPLVNFEEFIVGLFVNTEFQTKLNNIKYDSNKSLLDRLHDIVVKLVSEFTTALGIKKDSLLEESIKNVLTSFVKISEDTKPTILLASDKLVKKNLIDTSRSNEAPDIDEYSITDKAIAEEKEVKYNKIINDFKSRVIAIQRNITKAKLDNNDILAARLTQRKDEVEEELKNLLDNTVLNSIIKTANNDLDLISNLLKQPKVSTVDIIYAQRVLATWSNITEEEYEVVTKIDKKDDNKLYNTVLDIRNRANKLQDQWQVVAKESLLAVAQKETSEILTDDILNIQKTLGTLAANTLDLSRTGNIMLSVIDKWNRKQSANTKIEAVKIQEELEQLIKNLEKSEIYKKEGYDVFAEKQTIKDINGENKTILTGSIVSALIPEYYQKRTQLLNAPDATSNPKFRAKAWKEYFNWVTENHTVVDIRNLYKTDSDGKYQYNPNSDYLTGITKQLGDSANQVLATTKERINQYNEDLDLQLELNKEDPDGFRKIEEWKAQNDPSIYLRNLVEGYVEVKIGGKYIRNQGYKYTTRRALPKWENQQYNTIKQDENLSNFYQYFTKTSEELLNYIPYYLKRDFNNRSIPNIPKTIVEEYNQKGMRAALNGVGDSFINAITSSASTDRSSNIIDPSTGKFEKTLRVKYLKDINPEDKSYDLGKVLNAFALEALAYKHKSKVEDNIRLAQSILESAVEEQLAPNGLPLRDRFGDRTTVKGLKNFHDQLEYFVDAFYGDRKAEEGTTKYSKLFGKRLLTQKDKEAIENEIASIKLLDITEEEKERRIQEVKEDPKRYFSFGKSADTFLKYVQVKGMGWNIFASVTNLVFGWVSNINWAAGNVDFGLSHFWKANKIMLASTLSTVHENATAKKINALMVKYDTLKEIVEAAYKATTNTNAVRKGMEKLAPYELQRRGEYFVQGQTMIALMLNTKIKDLSGVEHSLWDAYDTNGQWKTDQFGNNKDWNGNPNNQDDNKEFFNFKVKLDQIIKAIHGNYDPNSPVKIKKTVLGRAALQFRSWVAEGFAVRFEDQKYDLLLQRERKGRYRTYVDLGLKGSLQTLAKQIIFGNSDKAFDALESLSPTDLAVVKENMKRNLAEIYTKASIFALYLLLSHLDSDDDDYKKWSNFTINQLYRLSDDIEFFYNPNALENISRSAIPAFTVIRDGSLFLDALGKAVIGEDAIETGRKVGQSRTLLRTAKLLPFTSSISSLINKTEATEAFRK